MITTGFGYVYTIECRELYEETHYDINERKLFAHYQGGDIDQFESDSRGPFVYNGRVVGIVFVLY